MLTMERKVFGVFLPAIKWVSDPITFDGFAGPLAHDVAPGSLE